jgi:protein-S-isoprenylcysteine O-methyltransferase Ste14
MKRYMTRFGNDSLYEIPNPRLQGRFVGEITTMLNNFGSNPIFWIGLFLLGYITTMVLWGVNRGKWFFSEEYKMGKYLNPIILFLLNIPAYAFPFINQPRFGLPTLAVLLIGIPMLALGVAVKISAGRNRTAKATLGLAVERKLFTSGIYGVIRHPIYLAVNLMPLSLAIIFKATYAVCFDAFRLIAYLTFIFLEEKQLEEEFGEEYREYKEKVRWRLIPYLF